MRALRESSYSGVLVVGLGVSILAFCSTNLWSSEKEETPPDLSGMWQDHNSQSPYSAPEMATGSADTDLVAAAKVARPGFLTGNPSTLKPFRFGWEYYRALPKANSKQQSGVKEVVDSYEERLRAYSGVPPTYVAALLCDPKQTVGVTRAAILQLLTSSGFAIEFPGWDEAGFLHARKTTFGEILVDEAPKLYEELRLSIRADYTMGDPKSFVSLIYQVDAGPRRTDRAAWSERTQSLPALRYVDTLRWKILNIIQSAFALYCNQIRSESTDGREKALEGLKGMLTSEQFESAVRKLGAER